MAASASPILTRDVAGTDPLARILFERLRLAPLRFALAFFLAGAAYLFGLAAVFGYLFNRTGVTASLADPFNQLNFLVIFPGVAYYYLWQPGAIAGVYAAVDRLASIRSGQQDVLWLKIKWTHAHSRIWIAGLSVGLLSMVAGGYDNLSRLGLWWYAANPLMIGVLQLARGAIFYMLTVSLTRHIAFTVCLSRCYRQFEMPLIVLPTRSPGMRAVGQYAFSFTALAAIVALNLGTAPVLATKLGVDYPYQVAAYLILAPLAFFLPMWQAHRYMARRRDNILNDLAERFQAEYARLLSCLEQPDQDSAPILERLNLLHASYQWTRKVSSWPIDTELFYRLAATILAPFAFTLLQVLLDRFLR